MDSFIQAITCMASQPCRRRQADFRSETATRIDPLSRETRPRGQPGIGPLSPVERLCVSRHRWRWRRRRHASCRMQLLWCSCSLPLGPPPGVLPLNVKMASRRCSSIEASDMHCSWLPQDWTPTFRTNFPSGEVPAAKGIKRRVEDLLKSAPWQQAKFIMH